MRVLIANVVRDASANLHYIAQLVWKESFAASGLSQPIQHFRIRIVIVRLEKADGINDGAGLFRHLQHLRQAVNAGVVGAVADDNQHLSYRRLPV